MRHKHFNRLHVNSGRKSWDPGFESFPKSSRVLTPIWAPSPSPKCNKEQSAWRLDRRRKAPTGVDVFRRRAESSGGGSEKPRPNRTHQLHLYPKPAPPFRWKTRGEVWKTHYLLGKTPFIYRVLTPGSNPLQKRRRTGSRRARCIMGTVGATKVSRKQLG